MDIYVKDPVKKMHLLSEIKTVSSVQQKTQWALIWCDPAAASFAKRRVCRSQRGILLVLFLHHLLVEKARFDAWAMF